MLKQLTFCLILMAFSGTPAQSSGKEAGNGGDGVVADFILSAREDLQIIGASKFLKLRELKNAIDTVHVESTNEVLVDKLGLRRDALNFPDRKLIVVNRARWAELTTPERQTLALHEYLGVLGLDDTTFTISYQLLGVAWDNTACGANAATAALHAAGPARGNTVSGRFLGKTEAFFAYEFSGGEPAKHWVVLVDPECRVLSVTNVPN